MQYKSNQGIPFALQVHNEIIVSLKLFNKLKKINYDRTKTNVFYLHRVWTLQMTGSVKVEDRFESFSVSEMVISGQFYVMISTST